MPLFETAVRISASNPYYLTNLACCLSHLDQYERALPIFKKALRLDPTNPLYLAHLGGCEAKLGIGSAEGNLKIAFGMAKGKNLAADSMVMKAIRSVALNHGMNLG